MRIYLLPRKGGKYILYSTEFQIEKDERNNPQESRKRFWKLIKSGYKTATAKREHSERLLKEMKSITQMTVYYPANLMEKEAEEIYQQVINAQVKKHKRWLIVDGALLPISAIFTLVPGPNVLMAYLAWRTLAHYKTKKGGEKAASELEIPFVKDPQLERLYEIVNKRFAFNQAAKIKAVGEEIGIVNLYKIV